MIPCNYWDLKLWLLSIEMSQHYLHLLIMIFVIGRENRRYLASLFTAFQILTISLIHGFVIPMWYLLGK
jgi:hypothetical protein